MPASFYLCLFVFRMILSFIFTVFVVGKQEKIVNFGLVDPTQKQK